MLARMGKMHELQPDRPKPKEHYELKELQHARTALSKDRTRLLNRYKTQTIAMLRKLTRNRLAQVERQMARIEVEIKAILCAAPKTRQAHAILCSIPGIADISASAILVECPEIGTLGRKQIASLAGLAPMTRQSGQWKGRESSRVGASRYATRCICPPSLPAVSIPK